MARMIPNQPSPDTKSRAELALFEAFARRLPDDYTVLHSVSWVVRDPRSGARDGESDFVLAHPERGILLVEVKGGHIRVDGATGQWFSNTHPIKNPFEQARTNKYSLKSKLEEIPFWRNRYIAIGHAVALPDVEVKQSLGFDAPAEIILDHADMDQLRLWVEGAYTYWKGAQPIEPIGPAAVRSLADLLHPSWDLRAPLAAFFAKEQEQLIRLTVEQHRLLDFLTGHRRVAISGCAGSGKTTLAVEQARRLAQQGFRVLLTCYNKNLSAFLRSDRTLHESVDIHHFHSLCVHLARKSGQMLPASGGRDAVSADYFDKTLPDALLTAIDSLGAPYDAVIVDEGQDFRPSWWLPLQCLLPDSENGVFYLFYDDNQNLYGTTQEPAGLNRYSLTLNCRNTQSIHRSFLPFYRGGRQPEARGPEGRAPLVAYYAEEHELRRRLGAIVNDLVVNEKVPTDQIVVLTQHSPARTILWQRSTVGNYALTAQWPPASGEIYATTVHQFKGLESPVVILAELAPSSKQDLDTLLYVGCSRARNHLIVVASSELPDELKARLPAPAA